MDREETDNACGCFAPTSFKESEPIKPIFKTMETKVCKRCGREFPLESFPACKRAKDGHLSVCKECNSKARSEARPGKRTVHVEEVALFPANDEMREDAKEQYRKDFLNSIPDAMLVAVLRDRGWEVTCKRTVVEEL